MSLLIWCPLNGDFKNYGLESKGILSSTYKAEFSDGGKIGKALYLKESNNDIPRFAIDNPVEYKQSYTIMGWFKTSKFNDTEVASTRKTLIACTTPIQMMSLEISVELSTVGEEKNKIILRIPNCNTEFAFEDKWEPEVWNHVALIVDGRKYKFFLNGEMVGNSVDELPFYDTPMSATISIGAIGMYYGIRPDEYLNPINNGYVNDIRIYDEILSISQIKKINKALVVHYNFEGQDFEQDENIIYDTSGYKNNGELINPNENQIIPSEKEGNYELSVGTSTTKDYSQLSFDSYPIFKEENLFDSDLEFTYCLWARSSSGASNYFIAGTMSISIKRGRTTTSTMNFLLRCKNSDGTNADVSISTSFVDDSWNKEGYNFICISVKKNIANIYINGKQKKTTTLYEILEDKKNIYINPSYSNFKEYIQLDTPSCVDGIDDFRVYKVALAEQDIQKLYNTKAMIDNKNNLISGNFIEVEDNTDYKKDDLFAGNYGTPFGMSSIYNRVAFNTQDYINDNKQMTVRVTSVKKDEVLVDYLKLDLKNDYLVEKLDKNKRYCFLVDLEINSTGNGEEIQKKRIDFSTYKDDNDDFYECPCIIFSIQKSSAWRVGDTIKISNMRIYEIVTGDEDFDETEPSKNTSKITNKYNVTTNLFIEESNKTKIAEGKITANEIIEI